VPKSLKINFESLIYGGRSRTMCTTTKNSPCLIDDSVIFAAHRFSFSIIIYRHDLQRHRLITLSASRLSGGFGLFEWLVLNCGYLGPHPHTSIAHSVPTAAIAITASIISITKAIVILASFATNHMKVVF